MYGIREMYTKYWLKILGERHERIILKFILELWVMRLWSGLNWLKLQPSCRILWISWTFCFILTKWTHYLATTKRILYPGCHSATYFRHVSHHFCSSSRSPCLSRFSFCGLQVKSFRQRQTQYLCPKAVKGFGINNKPVKLTAEL